MVLTDSMTLALTGHDQGSFYDVLTEKFLAYKLDLNSVIFGHFSKIGPILFTLDENCSSYMQERLLPCVAEPKPVQT